MKKSIPLIILTILISVLNVKSQDANRFFPEKDLITTGIYYYPEHWKESQWERDIKKISDMGYEFVHLAEFAWFKMEPEEGRFDFTWLDKVVGLCTKYNLKVLLCTPSATTPTWMRVNYAETFIMDGHYIRAENGTRGLGSIVNAKYRGFVKKIVSEMAMRYGQNKNVIGWQIDNEPGAVTDYSPSSQEAFRTWLKNKYKTINALNIAWGAAFWSQWFNNFDQVIIPNTNLVGWWGNNPHALLDFKRYSADTQAEFLDFQAGTLRSYISDNQYITTNYTAVSTGSDPGRTSKLDFAAYTAYPNGGSDNIGELGFRLGNSKVILFASEYYKKVGGVSGVMEIQPGPVNWGSYNPLLLPGTVRMWLYHSFAAGGKLACSYRFRQILYSAEQYHAGVILTDGVTPSPGGEEYMQFMKEIKELRKQYKPGAKMPEKLAARSTAILWNLENYWTIDRQKQTSQWDTWNYPVKFMEMAKSLGAPVDVIPGTSDLAKYKVVIIPAYEMVDSATVKKWKEYVAGGGHLIITCRTATKDRMGHFWEGELAAPISGLIGAHVQATDMLSAYAKGDIQMKSKHYNWNTWADLLVPDQNTEVLATYDNQFYKGRAAVVKHKIGKGSVTYIGANTGDSSLEKDLLRDIYADAGATTEDYPEGVYVYWRDGFYMAMNYSSTDYTVNIPGSSKILIGEKTLKPAGVLVWSE
ncbi:beta-galactosidase [Mucilaginibacter sp. BJC16-A38]|uniref:beta-galactosidase n=1 Tax=Mucilaginibacter phenanthrenivorans TaxID=1234842 RepID=UPI002157896D|nr:beta-galactosidase [Mucilaginibacter phenanthrenivorans]MCR8557218.1 beta-galactosidase [Mucilaginibacter phenanthrenivorans]